MRPRKATWASALWLRGHQLQSSMKMFQVGQEWMHHISSPCRWPRAPPEPPHTPPPPGSAGWSLQGGGKRHTGEDMRAKWEDTKNTCMLQPPVSAKWSLRDGQQHRKGCLLDGEQRPCTPCRCAAHALVKHHCRRPPLHMQLYAAATLSAALADHTSNQMHTEPHESLLTRPLAGRQAKGIRPV